jgi:hypothetical protein
MASLVFSLAAVAGENPVRYLRFDEVQETLRLNADSGLPGSEIQQSGAWDAWIRARDREVRGRIDRGIEDSISKGSWHPVAPARQKFPVSGRHCRTNPDLVRKIRKKQSRNCASDGQRATSSLLLTTKRLREFRHTHRW